MRHFAVGLAVLALALSACSRTPVLEDLPVAAGDPTCPDDGARLAETGICQGRAAAYFDPALGAPPVPAPADCAWSVNETVLATPEEAILYRALSCRGVTTKLAYAGGARSAELTYAASALGGDASNGLPVARIFVADAADPQAVIRSLIDGLPADEKAKCEVQPAGIEGWPASALVIGYNAEAAATLSKDEPDSVCGEYGRDEGSQKFWLVRQGYAWFYDLGQDTPEIDAASVTLIRKGPEGAWGAAE